MLRPVYSLQLPTLAITKLQESGFMYVEDILNSEDAKKEANHILRQWGNNISGSWSRIISPPNSNTALEMWQTECRLGNIITFCEQVDDILNGGIPLRKITEFCGAPGTGKTQFCLQLCVSVQIPEFLGGLSGEAVYLDTDSGFSPDRLRDIAKSCAAHCETIKKEASQGNNKLYFNVETILNGVHYIAINNHTELLATVSLFEEFLIKNKKIRLIIVDNLAFTFRYGATPFKLKTRLMYRVMSELQSLALKFNLAVVVTNHLTTFFEVSTEDGSISKSSLIPSLGESFAHLVGLRLMLGPAPPSVSSIIHGETPFMLLQTKSVDLPQASALFQIEDGGIRDAS